MSTVATKKPKPAIFILELLLVLADCEVPQHFSTNAFS